MEYILKYLDLPPEIVAGTEFNLFILAISSLLGFLAIFFICFRLRSQNDRILKDSAELTSGLRGRIEKMEKELNSLRTTILRGEQPEVKKKSEVLIQPATLGQKLSKTREGLFGRLKNLFSGKEKISAGDLDEVEELLVSSDIGIKTSLQIIEECKTNIEAGEEFSEDSLITAVKDKIEKILLHDGQEEFPIEPEKSANKPQVILVIGVNGVGKTTTVSKLAAKWKAANLKITLAAADTFRAAAVEQLVTWGERLDVPVITGAENAKPATVVFDALDKAIANRSDVLLIDTAGRLHNKANLMQELEGIKNVIRKKLDREPDEVILVLDGATGQNAISQAEEFNSVTPLSGVIVTKLDGTPKGGVVVAIKSTLNVPVRYIGVGESAEDLRVFNSREFSGALLG